MIFEELGGLLIFNAGSIFMFLVVPWERIKELILVGLVGGGGIALVLLYFMQNVFGFWIFHRVDLVNIVGVPIFLSAGWIPVVIAFSHFLTQYRNIVLIVITLLSFPMAATYAHIFLLANEMLFYYNWNLILTFIVALGLHTAIMFYLYATGKVENIG